MSDPSHIQPQVGDHGNEPFGMPGKVVLVVGGTGGIGREVTQALVRAGAHVVVGSPSAIPTPATCAAIPASTISYRRLDVSRYDDVLAVVADIAAHHGRLDGVVNCANIEVFGMGGRFDQVDPTRFDAFLAASLTTLLNVCHAALPVLSSNASLVTLASDAGRFAAPNQTLVGATRAAIMMFTRSLALEVAARGIRVNCISTSYVKNTPVYARVLDGPAASRLRTAEARAGLGLPDAEDIASLALFLCSPASAHMTGQVLSVNGGVSA